ncbi:MAG: hypothetical protein CMJ48_03905 [Planctomycetaceae bacterium]|nr:hypothetical protein [Planctomycetaceae bacterium]
MESRNDVGSTPEQDEAERVEAKRLILHDMASREGSSYSKGYFNPERVSSTTHADAGTLTQCVP